MAKPLRKNTQTRKSSRAKTRAGGISAAQRKKTRLKVEKMNKDGPDSGAFNVGAINDAVREALELKQKQKVQAQGTQALGSEEIAQGQKQDKRAIEERGKQEQAAASSLEDQIARMSGISL